MDDRRWLRLKELHERVFELPLDQARAYVLREFADDPELARELVSLLEQKTEGTNFLRFDDAPLEPSPFPPHHRLGDYELLHEIGRGGMGFVFMARHLPLERDVALKVLSPLLSSRPEQVDRFRREAQRLARFKNPGIVPIFDVQSIGNVHFFAMEHVDGLDLHRELVCLRGQLDLEDLPRHAAGHGLEGVLPRGRGHRAAGGAGPVRRPRTPHHAPGHQAAQPDPRARRSPAHRRLRHRARREHGPLARHGRGLGHALLHESRAGAPLSGRVVDHRTDIYSLGVVMYELLTLQRPFDGATQREVLKAIEVRDPKSVRSLDPRVPRDLAVVCHTAMEKEPEERYANAREFAADLERFLRGEPILASPPTFAERALRFERKNRTYVASGSLALTAVVAGFLLRDQFRADPKKSPVVFTSRSALAAESGGTLFVRKLDPVLAKFDQAQELGPVRVGRSVLPSGFARLIVKCPDGSVREKDVHVESGPAPASITLPSCGAVPASPTPMVRIQGGTLRRRQDPHRTLCSHLGLDIDIETFELDAEEVTVAQFRTFLGESNHPEPEFWAQVGGDPKYDRRPVILVSYGDMQAYAEYYGKRLPTHAELEWAGRGAEERNTPTGAPITPETDAPIHGESPRTSTSVLERIELWKQHSRDVGTSRDDTTPEGVHDLLGNVHEASSSPFVDMLTKSTPPRVMPGAFWTVGGAWWSDSPPIGLDAHGFAGVDDPGHTAIGFRCARSQ